MPSIILAVEAYAILVVAPSITDGATTWIRNSHKPRDPSVTTVNNWIVTGVTKVVNPIGYATSLPAQMIGRTVPTGMNGKYKCERSKGEECNSFHFTFL